MAGIDRAFLWPGAAAGGNGRLAGWFRAARLCDALSSLQRLTSRSDLLGADPRRQWDRAIATGRSPRQGCSLAAPLERQGRRCRHLTICRNSRCVDGRPRTKSGSLESAPETRLTRECVPPLRQVAQRIVTTSAELFPNSHFALTTGFAGPYDKVAAIVMAIFAAGVGIGIHPVLVGVVPRHLHCVPDPCRCPCGVDRVPAGILRDPRLPVPDPGPAWGGRGRLHCDPSAVITIARRLP